MLNLCTRPTADFRLCIHYVVRDISASTDIAYLLDNVVEKGYKITVF